MTIRNKAAKAMEVPSPPLPTNLNPRDRVVNHVIRGLYDGRFEPGQRLVESQLAEDCGVSRGPIREALNRLAVMGIIDLIPQRGAQIHILTIQQAIDNLTVAQTLVGIAARLAAERCHASKQGAQRLKDALAGIVRFDETSKTAGYAVARDSFYAALVSLAHNAPLSRVLTQVDIHLVRVQFRSILRSFDRRRHRDYIDIAESVLAGNASHAEKAARAHLGRSITALQTMLDKEAQ
ncbi:GntR family transcriptional regulator [Sphingobium sp. CFD-2]|uniref:GntR family transcriptional regulator n=1 Tax=Sphingobium sp. CFD-2 TaxID=2878542 RepID=UPI00214C5EF3|nr:GntR family transcriptional regulator [Sphingobium sp. CFD-2]